MALDKGLCEHRGEAAAKGLDGRSQLLLNAADRDAWGGVAPTPGGRRRRRLPGDSKIMAGALDALAKENKELGYHL